MENLELRGTLRTSYCLKVCIPTYGLRGKQKSLFVCDCSVCIHAKRLARGAHAAASLYI